MTLATARHGLSFTEDIAHSPVIEQAQAAWKTYREHHPAQTATATRADQVHLPAPNEPSHFRLIEEAQAAWKEWSARQRHMAPPAPDAELVQLRVWISRPPGQTKWHAHVQQVAGT